MKRLISEGFKEPDEIVLCRGLHYQIEIDRSPRQPVRRKGNPADHGMAVSLLLKEFGYGVEDDPEIHGYPITGNTVPACFGTSRPGSIPATSRSAASV